MQSMYNDDVVTSDFPKMGTDLPFENVSADGANPLRVKKYAPHRDPLGRYSPKASGDGEARARQSRLAGGLHGHRVVSDHSYQSPDERTSHAHLGQAQDDINHRLSCPACTALRG